MVFVRAQVGPSNYGAPKGQFTVHYFDEKGNMTTRPWKNQKQRRINFSLKNFSYIVVIAETRKGFDLVTAYPVEKPHRREKLRKESENFLGQKKEGSAV